MHGLGNDFVIFDAREQVVDLSAEKIRELSCRSTGIGFDQLGIIHPSKSEQAYVFFSIFNADGSEVEACGNLTRCIAKLLFKESGKGSLVLEAVSGFLECSAAGDKISVDMGEPKFKPEEIPLSIEEDTFCLPLEVDELRNPLAVNIGNPHAVFFVEDVSEINIPVLGPKIEHNILFPECVNVEVVQVLSRSEIRMRVWERGVGMTKACGTGACASAVAAIRSELTDRKVTVILDGGELEIEWREEDGHVIMTGDATEVFRGEIDL